MDPQPGDIIIYPAGPTSQLSSRIIIAGEIMAGFGSGLEMYSHASVYAGSGMQYEATFPKTRLSKIDNSRVYEIWNLNNPTPEQRSKIIEWCKAHVGVFYNLIGVVTFGILSFPGSYYCSQFACLAYNSVGLHPGDRIMSPDSIPAYYGANMIYRYIPQ
jgi:uncharacterized protein YycO